MDDGSLVVGDHNFYFLSLLEPCILNQFNGYNIVGFGFKLQVCERSLSNTQSGPSMPPVQNIVRAEMLPGGYLIRPCEGGGSIIHIVDHMNLEVIKYIFHVYTVPCGLF